MTVCPGRSLRIFVLAFAVCTVPMAASAADNPFGSIPGMPDLSHFPGAGGAHPPAAAGAKQGEPVVTTSLDDARVGVPFLDDFNPQTAASLMDLPRGPHGGFMVQPGLFEMYTESYCLNLALHAPAPGTGCLYAPMKGPDAPVVRSILQRSAAHPEIMQQQIQLLLWAVLARTKMSSLQGMLQATAQKLMTPEEISSLDKKAVEHADPFQGLLGALPPELRSRLQSQAQLRQLFTGSNSEIGALFSLAMAPGSSTPGKGDKPVPSGRWSFHPGGYFVRYMPNSFDETHLQLYVPEPFQIQRDGEGRITSLSDEVGNRIETTYDDQAPSGAVAGDPGVHGYAFKTIRFTHWKYLPPEVGISSTATWSNTGCTLVGAPSGGGHPSAAPGRYSGIRALYQSALQNKQQVQLLAEQSGVSARPAGGQLSEIVSLASYRRAIQAVVGKAFKSDEAWKDRQVDLITRAWGSALSVQLGSPMSGVTAERREAGSSIRLASFERLVANGTTPAAGMEYDPTGDVGVPGNTSTQRLAQSGRPSKGPSKGPSKTKTHKSDDCASAAEFIRGAREIESAYKDPALLEKARKNHWTAGQYELAIEAELAQGAKASGGKAPDMPAYTDPDTCKVTIVWNRNKFIQQGWPAFIYDAVVAHEQVHAKNCTERHKVGRPDSPDEDSQDEIEAYEAGIALVQKWIDEHCGPNASPLDPGDFPGIPDIPNIPTNTEPDLPANQLPGTTPSTTTNPVPGGASPTTVPTGGGREGSSVNPCALITKEEASAALEGDAEMVAGSGGGLICTYQTTNRTGPRGILTVSITFLNTAGAGDFKTPPDPQDQTQPVPNLGDGALLFMCRGSSTAHGNAIRVKKGVLYFTITVKPRVGSTSAATFKVLAAMVLGRLPSFP